MAASIPPRKRGPRPGGQAPIGAGILGLAEIERRRKAAKISIARLVFAAGLHPSTYRDRRKYPSRIKRQTLQRLTNALETLMAGQALPAKTLAPITALHRLAFAALAAHLREDVDLMLRQDFSAERPQNSAWLRASHLRRYAMWVLAIDLDLGNAAVGRAIGCSRQNVEQALKFVANAREDKTVDGAIAAVAAMATGRAT